MHNPFAIAVQWPDQPRRYLVHLKRPYFTAAIFETVSTVWLAVSWAPWSHPDKSQDVSIAFRAAADFCRSHLDLDGVPIEFVERKNGHALPRFLIAQSAKTELFIVEPDHPTPLVEVREADATQVCKPKSSRRFDIITEWRLEQMRKYYQHFLERQQKVRAAFPNTSGAFIPEKK
jgi:hypothetical protein